MSRTPSAAILLGAAITWLGAASSCTILRPQPDHSRFFLLAPQATPPSTKGIANDVAVGLGPVTLPGYLDRNQIATRITETRVDYSARDLWAEPLARTFVRVLSQNLGARLGTQEVLTHPWSPGGSLAYTVPVDVLRFDTDSGGSARLEARWAVKDSHGEALYSTESRFTEEARGHGREDAVAALSRTLGQLGDAIAAQIERLEATRRVATSDHAARRTTR